MALQVKQGLPPTTLKSSLNENKDTISTQGMYKHYLLTTITSISVFFSFFSSLEMRSILFFAAGIQAHTLFQKVSVNGVDQGDLTGVRVPDSNFVRGPNPSQEFP